ncbi:PAS domain-containing protein [Haloarcula sp. NS06]|uniref:PAS domain-containing response regulator n=1 Tax=unclassified Haloarcula TaxID=2624677 RepID=UPI0027B19B5B|nr:PAS domain-containing protein [Haloarcula sp. H-GB4]MDQ2073789.1 PAS domain S-box protein [Haloarcula sp. H-GB4]
MKILHLDDEPDFADLTAQFLEQEDERFEVQTATSGTDGLAILRAEDIDCIVSDYDMPGMDGLEFLAAVRQEQPDLPFILFTGKGSEEIASEAITAGVTEYIQKEHGIDQYAILANRITNLIERYRAVQTIDRSYRAMKTASEGISLIDPDGAFSYVNPAFADLFGYEQDELNGEHWTILYHDDEADRLENDIIPAVKENEYWSGETVRLMKGGDRLVTNHRLAYADDGVIVCTARDITPERMQLMGQSTQFDVLIEAMDDHAFFTLDHEGYVTRWNDGARQFTGYDVEEILGAHVSTFFEESDIANGLPEQLLETAKTAGSASHEGLQIRQDGTRCWTDMTFSASFDESGALRGYGIILKEADRQQIPQ